MARSRAARVRTCALRRRLRSFAVAASLIVGAHGLIGCGGGAKLSRPPAAYPTDGSGGHERAVSDAMPMAEAADDESASVSFSDDPLGSPSPAPPPAPPPRPVSSASRGATAPTSPRADAPRDGAQIVYTAELTIAVYEVERSLTLVEHLAHDLGGYVARKGETDITIRVPRATFEQALHGVGGAGDVIARNVQAEDVTDRYVDLEIRIKNARAMQARLQQLLQRAEVKDALEIEKELHRITEELELLEGKMKLLRSQVAYSTITVRFATRASAVQATRVHLPFPWLDDLGLPHLLSLEESK